MLETSLPTVALICLFVILLIAFSPLPNMLLNAYVNSKFARESRAEQIHDIPGTSEIHEVKSPVAGSVATGDVEAQIGVSCV